LRLPSGEPSAASDDDGGGESLRRARSTESKPRINSPPPGNAQISKHPPNQPRFRKRCQVGAAVAFVLRTLRKAVLYGAGERFLSARPKVHPGSFASTSGTNLAVRPYDETHQTSFGKRIARDGCNGVS